MEGPYWISAASSAPYNQLAAVAEIVAGEVRAAVTAPHWTANASSAPRGQSAAAMAGVIEARSMAGAIRGRVAVSGPYWLAAASSAPYSQLAAAAEIVATPHWTGISTP
jgi:hypothetical protein